MKTFSEIQEGLRDSVEDLFALHGTEADLAPMLNFFSQDGSSAVCLVPDGMPKPLVAAMAREISRKMDCYAVAFIAEGWGRSEEGDDRTELLFVAVDARNGKVLIHWPILRFGKRRTLGTASTYRMEPGATFSELLDPSLKED